MRSPVVQAISPSNALNPSVRGAMTKNEAVSSSLERPQDMGEGEWEDIQEFRLIEKQLQQSGDVPQGLEQPDPDHYSQNEDVDERNGYDLRPYSPAPAGEDRRYSDFLNPQDVNLNDFLDFDGYGGEHPAGAGSASQTEDGNYEDQFAADNQSVDAHATESRLGGGESEIENEQRGPGVSGASSSHINHNHPLAHPPAQDEMEMFDFEDEVHTICESNAKGDVFDDGAAWGQWVGAVPGESLALPAQTSAQPPPAQTQRPASAAAKPVAGQVRKGGSVRDSVQNKASAYAGAYGYTDADLTASEEGPLGSPFLSEGNFADMGQSFFPQGTSAGFGRPNSISVARAAPPVSSTVQNYFGGKDPQNKLAEKERHTHPKAGLGAGPKGGKRGLAEAPGAKAGNSRGGAGSDKSSSGSGPLEAELKAKLAQLEAEIARYQQETEGLAREGAEVARLKSECLAQREKLTKSQEDLDRLCGEEARKLERRKLELQQKERKLLNLPDRAGRGEIEKVTEQLNEARKEHKAKEDKSKAAVKRLETQLKDLQQENKDLKTELALLEEMRLNHWATAEKSVEGRSGKERERATTPADAKGGSNKAPRASPSKPQNPSRGAPKVAVKVPDKVPTSGDRPPQRTNQAGGGNYYSEEDNHGGSKVEVDEGARKITTAGVGDGLGSGHLRPSVEADASSAGGVASLDSYSTSHAQMHSDAASLGSKHQISSEISLPADPNRNGRFADPSPANNINSISHLSQPRDEPSAALVEEIRLPGDKVERRFADGSSLTLFRNGTSKFLSANKDFVKVKFPNGDFQETYADNRVLYYYASSDTTHTSFPDGTELFRFGDSQTERHHPNGSKQIVYADRTKKTVFSDGSSRTEFPDGRIEVSLPTGPSNFPASMIAGSSLAAGSQAVQPPAHSSPPPSVHTASAPFAMQASHFAPPAHHGQQAHHAATTNDGASRDAVGAHYTTLAGGHDKHGLQSAAHPNQTAWGNSNSNPPAWGGPGQYSHANYSYPPDHTSSYAHTDRPTHAHVPARVAGAPQRGSGPEVYDGSSYAATASPQGYYNSQPGPSGQHPPASYSTHPQLYAHAQGPAKPPLQLQAPPGARPGYSSTYHSTNSNAQMVMAPSTRGPAQAAGRQPIRGRGQAGLTTTDGVRDFAFEN
jgi:hypothetical protein